MSCIHKADQHGLLLRSLFTEWPRENLAQIYSGGDGYGESFCGNTFKLGPAERRLGNLFFRIKHFVLVQSSQALIHEKFDNQSSLQKTNRVKVLTNRASKFLLSIGLWELIFSPRLSEHLTKWVKDFDPQVIYCQGYDLTFCWLPIMLKDNVNIPIVFHPADDWPNQLYYHVPAMRSLVIRTTKKLIQNASARIAFSDRMADGYYRQFGSLFDDIVMHCDNLERFVAAKPQRVTDDGVISIVYTGGLGHGRWQSLLDLCDATDVLRADGMKIEITAFLSSLPVEAAAKLRIRSGLKILPSLAHQQVPAYLKGADTLFLPETFDPSMATDIRYSISTKAHLYMMSKQPILVYGSPEAGVVDYAKRDGWGYVVDQRKPELLVEAIRRLSTDKALRTRVTDTGIQIFLRNHDQKTTCRHFYSIIQSVVAD